MYASPGEAPRHTAGSLLLQLTPLEVHLSPHLAGTGLFPLTPILLTMPHSNRSVSPLRDAFAELPPFPAEIPTAPLLRVSLARLLQRDTVEQERCWKACCDLGFFYLDLRDSQSPFNEHHESRDDNEHTKLSTQMRSSIDGQKLLHDADVLFEVMKDFFDLPVEEKMKYDFAEQGSYFGYKGYGAGVVDKTGTRDKNEFYNVSHY
jgi:hypothetical protein